MTARVSVTVSEPVTRDISADDVRAYLVARGWRHSEALSYRDHWIAMISPTKNGADIPLGDHDEPEALAAAFARCVEDIARHEKREPADVLRDIAFAAGVAAVVDPREIAEPVTATLAEEERR